MKAKKKPIDAKTPADFGVDVTPRLSVLKTVEPPARQGGVQSRLGGRTRGQAARDGSDPMTVLLLAEQKDGTFSTT